MFASRNSGFQTLDWMLLAALRFNEFCTGPKAEDGEGGGREGGRIYRADTRLGSMQP